MTAPRRDPPVGGTQKSIVDHNIQQGQQDFNTAVLRNKDLTIGSAKYLTASGPVVLTGATAPVLNANVVTYSMPGENSDRSSVLRMRSSVAVSIEGIKKYRDGELVRIINVGAFNITFKNLSALVLTQHRVSSSSGSDTVLAAEQSAELWYDPTSLLWRVLRP